MPQGSRFGFGRGNWVIELNVGACNDVDKKAESGERKEMKRIKAGVDE